MITRLYRIITVYNTNGLYYVLNKILYKSVTLILGVILTPISVIMYLLKFRVAKVDTTRIGHFAIEPDIILKAMQLGRLDKFKFIIISHNKKKLINTY